MKYFPTRSRFLASTALLAALAVFAGPAVAADGVAGALYTLSNSPSGNAVLVFNRSADGNLDSAGVFATGGLGSGVGLGSQGALVLSENGRWLYAVNAGSNEISSFAVSAEGLSLVSQVGSGGVDPISLTLSRDLLYVLNAGDATNASNIAGFRVGPLGELSALEDSIRPLSGPAVGPAQIQFSPDGHVLVVTEKGTNLIDTYIVGDDGFASEPNAQASAGMTPFGFDFDRRGHLIVSDAFGGAAGASALSSYSVGSDGVIEPITALAPDTQSAACWVVTTRNGRYAYTTNTGSGNVSSYRITRNGTLTLLDAVAGITGAGPIDAAIARNSRYLYTLDAGGLTISAFEIQKDGSLAPLAGVTGLPAGAAGLAAQ